MNALRAALALGAGVFAAIALLDKLPPAASFPEGVTSDQQAPAALAGLQVVPEDTGAHYRREDWGTWTSREGCDTRAAMLIKTGRQVELAAGCRVVAGEWVSGYDGVAVTDPSALDIDHVVPLAEVMRSGRVLDGRRIGPRGWSADDRERYANDPAVLAVVTARANRSKGDQDPARWLPDQNRCDYVRDWVRIKHHYGLSIDPAEHAALEAVFARCAGGER